MAKKCHLFRPPTVHRLDSCMDTTCAEDQLERKNNSSNPPPTKRTPIPKLLYTMLLPCTIAGAPNETDDEANSPMICSPLIRMARGSQAGTRFAAATPSARQTTKATPTQRPPAINSTVIMPYAEADSVPNLVAPQLAGFLGLWQCPAAVLLSHPKSLHKTLLSQIETRSESQTDVERSYLRTGRQ